MGILQVSFKLDINSKLKTEEEKNIWIENISFIKAYCADERKKYEQIYHIFVSITVFFRISKNYNRTQIDQKDLWIWFSHLKHHKQKPDWTYGSKSKRRKDF